MEYITWGFWWLNVVLSAGSILYQARDRYPDGTPGLMMPSGQIWIWQLIFSFVVLATGISPWNLLWLGLVSIVLSIIVSKFWRDRMLAARYPDIWKNEVQQTDNRTRSSSAPATQLETRTYQGASYLKDANGKWHLQQMPNRTVKSESQPTPVLASATVAQSPTKTQAAGIDSSFFCSHCGAAMPGGARFCSGCGNQVIPSILPSNGPNLQQSKMTMQDQDADFWYHRALTLTEKPQFLECLECLERAVKADPKHKQALFALGHHYLHGQGTKEDPPTAAIWFRKSAELGFAPAQSKLGLMYEHGIGVAKNATEAVKWYALAAQSGNRDAQYYLGVMYGTGTGVPTDYVKSSQWLLKAAKQGNVDAQATLGQLLLNGADGVPNDYEEAAIWLRKAADAGDTQAQVTLADLFVRGKGLQKNLDEAARYFSLAAEQGDADGQQGLKFVNMLLGRWTSSEERLPGEEEWEFDIRRMVESTRFSFNPPNETD